MELAELFTTLAERGLCVRRQGDGLECTGRQEQLTPELKRHLLAHRETLLSLLPAATAPAPAESKYVMDPEEKTALQWWECCLPPEEQEECLRRARREWSQLTALDLEAEIRKPAEPLPDEQRLRFVRPDLPKYPPGVKRLEGSQP